MAALLPSYNNIEVYSIFPQLVLNFSKKFNRNFLRNPSFSKIYQRIKYKKIPSSPKLNLLERVFETGRGRLIPRKNLAKIPRSPKHQNIRSTFSPRAKKISLSLSPLPRGGDLSRFVPPLSASYGTRFDLSTSEGMNRGAIGEWGTRANGQEGDACIKWWKIRVETCESGERRSIKWYAILSVPLVCCCSSGWLAGVYY